jgi:hypothetical protein
MSADTVRHYERHGLLPVAPRSATGYLTAAGELSSQVGTFYCVASQNITYSTTVTGAAGSPQYALRIRLEPLG